MGLNARGRLLLSDQCVLDAAAEARELLAALPKTKENKAHLNALLKEVKGLYGAATHQSPRLARLTRRQYREHCVSLLQHWESNLRRDVGCLAPCLFVVAAVVRVALEEVGAARRAER